MKKKDRAHFLQNFDLSLLIATVILTLFGILMIFSATQVTDIRNTESRQHLLQILWFILSLIALLVLIFVPYRIYDFLAYPVYGVFMIILLLLLIFGSNGTFRAHRWLVLGPIRFQPSEFAKIVTVLAMAKFLASQKKTLDNLKRLIVPTLIVLVPFVLILREPDLGTSLVFIAIWLGLTFWAGLHRRYYFYLATPVITLFCALFPLISSEVTLQYKFIPWLISVLIAFAILYFSQANILDTLVIMALNLAAGIGGPFVWHHLKSYQQNRIITFLYPDKDPLGSGYQIIQSKIAIGSGGLLGKGLLEGTQKRLAFLPEQHTDFIFSVVGEELGFFVCVLVLLTYLFIIVRAILLAIEVKDKFASLTIIGLISVFTFHVLVNVGMAVGLMPVTGLPLPLLSYGGSSLLSTYISMGIILGIGVRRFEE